MLVPFVALCIAAGMSWSLRAKTVLGAVVPTIGIIAMVVLVLGLCGISAFGQTAFVGPIVNAFSPMSGTLMLIDPWNRVNGFAQSPTTGRGLAGLRGPRGRGGLRHAGLGHDQLDDQGLRQDGAGADGDGITSLTFAIKPCARHALKKVR